MKYLVLEFRNAGLFNDNRKSKDKSFDNIRGNNDRKNIGTFTEPITIHQVSNMLHVLFGERPVPMHRYSVQSKIDKYVDMASNSFLNISTYKKPLPHNSLDIFYKEKIRMKKAVHNAHSSPTPNWAIVKEYIGTDLFEQFTKILSEKYNIVYTSCKFTDAMSIVRNNIDDIADFMSLLEFNKKSALSVYIKTNISCITQYCDMRVKHTFANGIDSVARLNGRILVPVTDDDLLKLSNSVGTATILDGGLIYIKCVVNDYALDDIDDYVKISEICTEINELSFYKL